MLRQRFRGSVLRLAVLLLVEVAVAVAAISAMMPDIEGKLLLLLDGVGDSERSRRLGDGGVDVSLSKMRPLKIAWKSASGSSAGGIILAFLSTLGSGVAFEVKVPCRIEVMSASEWQSGWMWRW